MGNMIKKLDSMESSRPAYTKYELSMMVKEKRRNLGMSVDEFSKSFKLEIDTIKEIEEANLSFNARLLKACSLVLEIPIENLIKRNSESIENYSFRSGEINSSIKEIVGIVDGIFNEIVMQRKLSVR